MGRIVKKGLEDESSLEESYAAPNDKDLKHSYHPTQDAKSEQAHEELKTEGETHIAQNDTYNWSEDEDGGRGTSANFTDDGRINININHLSRRLSQIFAPVLSEGLTNGKDSDQTHQVPLNADDTVDPPPRLNILIQVVGSRGDVQPFVALGKVLKTTYGHRVRIATHPTFKNFVLEHGLEFFSIGGDPSRLMAFMVKNPSLMPGFRSVASGDVSRRRADVAEYIQGCWRSCYLAEDGTDGDQSSVTGSLDGSQKPAKHFVADLIIANPPSFAHVHCAEALGIPLHIVFTMPYSPTRAFPHPLANIQSTNADPQLTNYISYAMIELLSWQGLGDIINRFRAKCLGLDPVSSIWGPGTLQRLKIPHTYCWSPALIPKPRDWGSQISIPGFFFLDSAANYAPAEDLRVFLDHGPPPVYIGFGSIVLEDPDAMTQLIFEAARQTGQRFLLSKGWGGLGADKLDIPSNIFMLGNVPHDWLFRNVSCVVHHGGAGTTSAGIAAGRPTLIVPFFGDQPFWGDMIARAGAGPRPIPHKELTADKLADAIMFCLSADSLERAKDLASRIATEKGCEMGARSIHQSIEPERLRCALSPSRTSVWCVKRTKVRLSAFAACTLANANLLDFQDLKLFRPQEHYIDEGPLDPVSGGFTAFVGAVGGMSKGIASIPSETWRAAQSTSRRVQTSRASSTRSIPRKSDTSLPASRSTRSEASLVDEGSNPAEQISATSLSETRKGNHPNEPPQIRRSNTIISQPPSHTFSTPPPNTDLLRPKGFHMTKGAGRFVKAVVQGPIEISVNLTRGMHNIPKLWGDDTVRPQERVTDMKTGVRAVGREFGFGFYDAITGLVTQPLRGAEADGATGFLKGVGKGVGGFVPKMGAACLGILSHTLQGINKEAQQLFSSNVQTYIVASRAAQGYEEWLASSDAEKEEVVAKWKTIQQVIEKKGWA